MSHSQRVVCHRQLTVTVIHLMAIRAQHTGGKKKLAQIQIFWQNMLT